MSRSTWLPVSAQECAASASSDADPVTTAATDFATATRRLTAKAMRTVVRLAEPATRAECESGPRNGSDFTAAPRLAGSIMPQASRAKPRVASAGSPTPCGYSVLQRDHRLAATEDIRTQSHLDPPTGGGSSGRRGRPHQPAAVAR